MTNLDIYRSQSCSSATQDVLDALIAEPGSSGCTSDSTVEDLFHPKSSSVVWLTPTTNNNGTIDNAAECNLLCTLYPDGCNWTRWHKTNKTCQISISNAAQVDLTRANGSCLDGGEDSSNYEYYYSIINSAYFPFTVLNDSQDSACATN